MKCVYLLVISTALTFSTNCIAQTRSLSPAEQKIVSDAFGKTLKDPVSAQYKFPQVPASSEDGERSYCFQVNAKNSYGGYSGQRVIVGKLRRQSGKVVAFSYVAGHLDDSPALAQNTIELCRVFGFEF